MDSWIAVAMGLSGLGGILFGLNVLRTKQLVDVSLREAQSREKEEAGQQTAWEEFTSCVGSLSPLLAAQLKDVIEETGRKAEGCIQRLQALAIQAKKQATSTALLAGQVNHVDVVNGEEPGQLSINEIMNETSKVMEYFISEVVEASKVTMKAVISSHGKPNE